jgi:CRP-like cAMP-binding protein
MEIEASIPVTEHWLFAGIPAQEAATICASLIEVHFQPGDVLVRQGDASDGLYLIGAGSLQVTASNDQGATFLSIVNAGQVLGELGALDGQPRSATAVALSAGLAYFVPSETFLKLLDQSNDASRRLLMMLVSRLRRTNDRLMQLPPQGPVWRRTIQINP